MVRTFTFFPRVLSIPTLSLTLVKSITHVTCPELPEETINLQQRNCNTGDSKRTQNVLAVVQNSVRR
jgi:hypothetical protein